MRSYAALIIAFASAVIVQAAPAPITGSDLQARQPIEAELEQRDPVKAGARTGVTINDILTARADEEEEEDPVKRSLDYLAKRAVVPGKKWEGRSEDVDASLLEDEEEVVKRWVDFAKRAVVPGKKWEGRSEDVDATPLDEEEDTPVKRMVDFVKRAVVPGKKWEGRSEDVDATPLDEEEDTPVKRMVDFVKRAIVPGKNWDLEARSDEREVTPHRLDTEAEE